MDDMSQKKFQGEKMIGPIRLFVVLVLLCFFISGCCKNSSNEEKYTEMEKVLAFNPESCVSEWVKMWNSYDLALIDRFFLSDANVTYFSSEKEGLIRGIDSIRKHHQGFGFVPGGKEQKNRLWVEDIHSRTFGSVAVVKGIWYFRRGQDDSNKIQKGPFTAIYVKKEKKYLIAHMHFANYN